MSTTIYNPLLTGQKPELVSPTLAATGVGTFFARNAWGFTSAQVAEIQTQNQLNARGIEIPDDVAAAYADLMYPRINRLAYGWQKLDGQRPQVSEDRLNRHFAAIYRGQMVKIYDDGDFTTRAPRGSFVRAISQKRLIRGLTHPQDILYLRSAYDSEYVLIRIDLDCHYSENDLPEFRTWFQNITGITHAYHDTSARGGAVYMWLRIPAKTIKKRKADAKGWKSVTRTMAAEKVNKTITDLNHSLTALAVRDGWVESDGRARIEVQGSVLEITQLHDEHGVPCGPLRVVNMGGTNSRAKQPTVRTMADVEALRAAEINITDERIQRVIHEGLELWRQMERERMAADATNEVPEPKGPRSRVGYVNGISPKVMKLIQNATDKVASANGCCYAALNQNPNRPFHELLGDALNMYATIPGTAATGPCEKSRIVRFTSIMRRAIKRYDGSARGTSEDETRWFNDPLAYADDFRRLCENIGKKLKYATYEVCSTVYLVMRKNIVNPLRDKVNGQSYVPQSAVKKMLAYFGLCSNGSAIREAMELCQRLGFITCADKSYQTGVRCRKWSLGNNSIVHHENNPVMTAAGADGSRQIPKPFIYHNEVLGLSDGDTSHQANTTHQDNRNQKCNDGNLDRFSCSSLGNANLW